MEKAISKLNVKGQTKVWMFVIAVGLGVLGRVMFSGIPSVQPVTVICILMGMYCGKNYGLGTGVSIAFVSNEFLLQGWWTLFQAVGWGLAGYLAGVLLSKESKSYKVIGITVVMSLLFGILMDLGSITVMGMFDIGFMTTYMMYSLPFNLAHVAGSVVFITAILGVRNVCRRLR